MAMRGSEREIARVEKTAVGGARLATEFLLYSIWNGSLVPCISRSFLRAHVRPGAEARLSKRRRKEGKRRDARRVSAAMNTREYFARDFQRVITLRRKKRKKRKNNLMAIALRMLFIILEITRKRQETS